MTEDEIVQALKLGNEATEALIGAIATLCDEIRRLREFVEARLPTVQ